MGKQIQADKHREDEPVNRSQEMGVMIDIVLAATAHETAVNKINQGKCNAWDRYDSKEINTFKGGEEYTGENHCRYSARCTDRVIPPVVPVPEKRDEGGNDYASEIEQAVGKGHRIDVTFHFKFPEPAFNIPAEEIEHEHIDQEMCPVRMHEAMSDQPEQFLFP